MIVSIHQPDYIPWMGLFDKIAKADIFVFLDDAQYSNIGFNKNVIKGPNGIISLSVPVLQHFPCKINEVLLRDELPWRRKHLRSIEMSYSKAKHFDDVYPLIEKELTDEYKSFADMNMVIITDWVRRFDIETKILKSSDLPIHSVREERIFDICECVGGDEYLSGNGARAYQEEEHFMQHGIKLTYQTYKPLVYPQIWGEFCPNMSALDYIMNCGFLYPENH